MCCNQMHHLLDLVRFLLVINLLCVTAVNHEAGNEADTSNSKNSRTNQLPQGEPVDCTKKRYAHSTACSSRFQKNADLLDAPQPPSDTDKSQNEAFKNFEPFESPEKPSLNNESPEKPSLNNQNSPGAPTKAKEAAFTDILFTGDVDKAKLKDSYVVPMAIKLKDDCDSGVTFLFKDTITKDMAEHFEAKCDAANKKQIQMKLIKNFADNVLSKLGLITLILRAEDKDNNNKLLSETVVWMKVFTKPSKDEKLTFEKSKYEIESLYEYVGVVEQFKATMVNDLNAIIKYSIISIDSGIKDTVTIDTYTGAFQVKKSLQPGQYSIKIQAETADEKYKDSADVVLSIKYTTVCNTKDLSFVHSLLVVTIPQGKVVQDVVKLDKQQDGCVYNMVSQKPAEGYFDLNVKTGSLSLKKEVFRSDQIFGNKNSEPKFVLDLEIRCNAKKSTSKPKRSATGPQNQNQKNDEKAQIDDSSSIMNNPKKLIVDVLIDDEGPLVFPEAEVFFGYPQSYDFIEDILPSSIFTVQVDRKNLKNDADIRYEIEEKSDCLFTIHPTSGKLYPQIYATDSRNLKFTVIARRMDKDKVIAEAKTEVTVFFLTLKQIVQIDLTEEDFANIDSPLQSLKVESNIILRELSHAVLPQKPLNVKEAQRNDPKAVKHLIRVYSYGFDTKQHAIVDGDVILEKLKSSPNIVDIDVIQVDSSKIAKKSARRFWPSGLFICIVVILLIFGAFGSYLLYAKNKTPLPFGRMRSGHHDHTSTTPLEDDMEGPSRTRWISSAMTNPFSKFNNTSANARPPYNDFRTRNVAFSFHTADATLDSTNTYSDLPNTQLGNLSSFKPEVLNERDTPLNVINLQSEPTYGTLTSTEPRVDPNSTAVQNTNVPILPVIMLPPVAIDRNRRNRRVSTETRGDNVNGAGISSKTE